MTLLQTCVGCGLTRLAYELTANYPTKAEHYARNNGYDFPTTMSEFEVRVAQGEYALGDPVPANAYQIGMQPNGPSPLFNEKFTTQDGGEVIYDQNGNRVDDFVNQGTANSGLPDTEPLKHAVADVAPHIALGTHPIKDPTTVTERFLGLLNPRWGYNGDVSLTKAERAKLEEKQRQEQRRQANEARRDDRGIRNERGHLE
jgi:hypothetical protein